MLVYKFCLFVIHVLILARRIKELKVGHDNNTNYKYTFQRLFFKCMAHWNLSGESPGESGFAAQLPHISCVKCKWCFLRDWTIYFLTKTKTQAAYMLDWMELKTLQQLSPKASLDWSLIVATSFLLATNVECQIASHRSAWRGNVLFLNFQISLTSKQNTHRTVRVGMMMPAKLRSANVYACLHFRWDNERTLASANTIMFLSLACERQILS